MGKTVDAASEIVTWDVRNPQHRDRWIRFHSTHTSLEERTSQEVEHSQRLLFLIVLEKWTRNQAGVDIAKGRKGV